MQRSTPQITKLAHIASAVNVPIVFYGKVVDQFNQPVEGVRVAAFHNRWSIAGLIEQRAGRLTNYFSGDTDGQFVVKGIRGASMTIQLEKTGYELAPHCEMTFAFDPGAQNLYVPNPAKPVVYHMWKRQGGAELVGRWFEKTVRADGTPISLDLENEQYVGHKGWKTIIDATNLPGPTVRVWREPFLYDPQTSLPEAWRYEFVIPGGKAQFTEDEFCYLAPEIGCKDKLEVSFHKGDSNFRFRDKRSLYFVNQKGKYGQGIIEIWSDYTEDKAIVTLSVSWNPDGSRNLEPKPE